MERLGSVGRAHAVHLNNHEAKISQVCEPSLGAKRFWCERSLWTGVDLFNHRILLLGIESARSANDAPNVGLAVAPLRNEDFGRRPTLSPQFRNVGFLEPNDQFAVFRTPQFMYGCRVDGRVGIDDELAIRGN